MLVRTLVLVIAIGFFGLDGRSVPAAANDLVANAIPVLQTPYTHSTDTSGFNAQPFASDPELICGSGDDDGKQSHTAWYRVQPVTGGSLAASTEGSDYDTVLGLWSTGPGGTPTTLLACNDNESPGDITSQIPDANDLPGATQLIAGMVYLLEVASLQRSPGGQLELAVTYTGLLAPVVTALAPSGVVAGSGEVEVVLTGSGFVAGSVVKADGNVISSAIESPTSISAALPAEMTTAAGSIELVVVAPSGAISNLMMFRVVGAPVIDLVEPRVVEMGSGAQEVAVAGSGFVDGETVVLVDGEERSAEVDSATVARVTILAGDTSLAGWLTVEAENRVDGIAPARSNGVEVLVRHSKDVQCDGAVTSADVLAMLRAMAGLEGWADWCPGGEPSLGAAIGIARVVAGLPG